MLQKLEVIHNDSPYFKTVLKRQNKMFMSSVKGMYFLRSVNVVDIIYCMHFKYLFAYKCETAGHLNVRHFSTESGITKK